MNLLSRTITGSILVLLGISLIVAGFFTMFITWIYGIPSLIIGIFILLNTKEDKIEERKDLKVRGPKKQYVKKTR